MFRPYKHTLSTMASYWAEAIHYYRKWREAGLSIVGIRYEDIIADPETNMRRILRHCDLPEHLSVNSLRALKVDSQRNTPFSGKSLSQTVAVPEYSGETRAEIDAVCESYGLPSFSNGPYVAPGTITSGGHKGSSPG